MLCLSDFLCFSTRFFRQWFSSSSEQFHSCEPNPRIRESSHTLLEGGGNFDQIGHSWGVLRAANLTLEVVLPDQHQI